MTNDDVRPAAGGPVHRRYCGECGTRIDQLCPKCYLAAQPEPPKDLQEAVEIAWFKAKNRHIEAVGDVNDLCIDDILAAVRPLVVEYRDMIRRLIALQAPHEDDWGECPCWKCGTYAEARALIGGEDE